MKLINMENSESSPDACEGVISLQPLLELSRNASLHQRRVTIQKTAVKETGEGLQTTVLLLYV